MLAAKIAEERYGIESGHGRHCVEANVHASKVGRVYNPLTKANEITGKGRIILAGAADASFHQRLGQDMATIPLDKTGATNILADLEYLVTSLDRMGAAAGGMPSDERAMLAERFLKDADVFRRLATARRVLSEALEQISSRSELEAFERKMAAIRPWDWSKPASGA